MLLLTLFLDIVVLGALSISDVRTHRVPKLVTGLFVLGSLAMTNLYFLLGAAAVCVLMFATNPIMKSSLGPGDRKILFGLSLQCGWFPAVAIWSFVLAILFLHKATEKKKGDNPVPLMPFILIGFIIWIFYSLITNTLQIK